MQCTCIVKINTLKIGKIPKVEINLSVSKLRCLDQYAISKIKMLLKATSHSTIFDILMRPMREDQRHRDVLPVKDGPPFT